MHKETNVTQRRRLIFYFDGSHKNGAKLKYKHYKKKKKRQWIYKGEDKKGAVRSLRQYKLTSWHTTEIGGGWSKFGFEIKEKGRSHVSIAISFITSHAFNITGFSSFITTRLGCTCKFPSSLNCCCFFLGQNRNRNSLLLFCVDTNFISQEHIFLSDLRLFFILKYIIVSIQTTIMYTTMCNK